MLQWGVCGFQGIAPLILNLGNRWRRVVSFVPGQYAPSRKDPLGLRMRQVIFLKWFCLFYTPALWVFYVSSGLSPALADPCCTSTLCNETLCLLSGVWCHVDWFWVPTICRSLLLPPAGWSVWNSHIQGGAETIRWFTFSAIPTSL